MKNKSFINEYIVRKQTRKAQESFPMLILLFLTKITKLNQLIGIDF